MKVKNCLKLSFGLWAFLLLMIIQACAKKPVKVKKDKLVPAWAKSKELREKKRDFLIPSVIVKPIQPEDERAVGFIPDPRKELIMDKAVGETALSEALNESCKLRKGQGLSGLEKVCRAGKAKAKAKACFRLAACYHSGKVGVTDLVRAAQYYNKACDHGEMMGCLKLSTMYFWGEGVVKDVEKALALAQLAFDSGSNDVKIRKEKDFIKDKPSHIAAAQLNHDEEAGKSAARAAGYLKMMCHVGIKKACLELESPK